MNDQNELLHYGVLGMKWGRRKNNGGGILNRFRKRKTKKNVSEEQAPQQSQKGVNERLREQQFINEYKNRDKMSTKQIQARTNRLNAEMAFERAVMQKSRDRQLAAQKLAEAEQIAKAKKTAKNMKRLKVALTIVGELGIENLAPKVTPKDFGFENEEALKKAGGDIYNNYQNAKKGSDEMKKILTSVGNVTKAVAKSMDNKPDHKNYIEQSGVKMKDKNDLLHSIYESEDQDILLHGTKWSEEAKERVRQARRAGRSVRDMFSNFYKSASKKTNRTYRNVNKSINKRLNKLAGRTIYKENIKSLRARVNGANQLRNQVYKNRNYTQRDQERYRKLATGSLKDFNKDMKRYTKAKNGQLIKDFSKEGVKQAKKLTKSAIKSGKRIIKDTDKAITKKLNSDYEKKDRAKISKKERAKIVKTLQKGEKARNDKMREKSVYKDGLLGLSYNGKGRRVRKDRGSILKNFINGDYTEREAKLATKRAEAERDRDRTKVIRNATEATVNKKKYNSTGDYLNKQANKIKKKLAKKAKDIYTNKGKGFEGTVHTESYTIDDFDTKTTETKRKAKVYDNLGDYITGRNGRIRKEYTSKTSKSDAIKIKPKKRKKNNSRVKTSYNVKIK